MLPDYKMFPVNVALTILLIIGFGIYRYVLRQKVNPVFLVILISILPIISIFRIGTYESGDLSIHTQRLMSFYNLLINYHLIPRWTPEFNAGYGDPHFLFAYFLPYFAGSLFHLIGFSFLSSMKLLLATSFVASGIVMYFWVKEEIGEKSAFVSAVFYLFMPYHLLDMHFRVTVAESLSFVFLPLILLAGKRLIEKSERKWFITLSISIGLLILSHQAISVMFMPIALAYFLFVWKRGGKKVKRLLFCFGSLAAGFLLTSFYWLPIIFLAKFTQLGANPTRVSFPTFTGLLYTTWRYGFLFQGPNGQLSYLIGYTQIIVILLSIYLLLRNKLIMKDKSLLMFFLIIFTILFIFILPISNFIWKNIPLLKYSQYSTRLLVPLALCISILAGVVVKVINRNWFIFGLCFLTIFYTILNWGNRRTIPVANDDYLRKAFEIKPDLGVLEPTSPIWVNLAKSNVRIKPKLNVELLNGNAIIKNFSKTPTSQMFSANVRSKYTTVKDNIVYFPGWIVSVNGRRIPINYTNSKYPGIITFNLSPGSYTVVVRFADLPIIVFSKWLSGLSLLGIIIYAFLPIKLHFPKS